MIDIHTHILTNVDDGCKDYNEAGKIILEAKKQDVNAIFLTPHQNTYSGYDAISLIEKYKKFYLLHIK